MSARSSWVVIAFASLLLTLAGCVPLTPVPPVGAPASAATAVATEEPAAESALTQEALANMEYYVEYTASGVAPLVDGEYREPAAPGSAAETVVQLTDSIAYGTLDGQEAAAVVLVSSPGGSGTFYDLAVVVVQDGAPVNVATTLLGDRVQINSLAIENDQIVVDMLTAGPNDPMCCPSQQVVQTYELEGALLVLASEEIVSSGEPAQPEATAVPAEEPAAAPSAALSPESLANATYMSEWTEGGTVTLENGEFEAPAAPGSASMIQVGLTEYIAYGDLTADGVDDAAVILWSSGGGSGTFYDLAAMVDQDGVPVNVATAPLGDRVTVNSLAIQDGQIVVDYVRPGPNDPACCPSEHVVEAYELHAGQLLLMSSQAVR